VNDAATLSPTPTVARKSQATYVAGRRAFFKYRDLGATAATNGRLRAQITSADSGMSKPTGWYVHKCEAQLVYMLAGWIDLEFAGEPVCHLEAGDAILIPGNTPHNEIRTSDSFELLEVSLPAEMGTEPCDPPPGR
jgi:mannose-6-phosphate isomerase-like protein (cupin superfamily)